MTKVLVTGATGNVGSRVVHEVRRRAVFVRAFVRNPERAAGMLGDGVELASGDFSDAASVRHALEDVDAVFLACSNDPRQVEYETGVIDAAKAAGVRRIVKLSALGAEVGSPLAFWDWHGRIENHLRASGVPAVVLQPTFYMTNLLASAEGVSQTDALFAPAAGAKISMIDPADVAAAAAATLTNDGHEGRTYVLTGPEEITYERVAREISAATGRRIEFVTVPDEEARQGMAGAGMPEFVAEQFITLFGLLRRGAYERTTDAVRSLTGRGPRTFARFARDHAGLWTTSEELVRPHLVRAGARSEGEME
jgi:uncharacterized protein YbjT (DUF2867 family)